MSFQNVQNFNILIPLDETPSIGDKFGTVEVIYGNEIFIAAPGQESNGFADAGEIYCFRRETTGEWQYNRKINLSIVLAGTHFGEALGVDDDFMVVGGPGFDSNKGIIVVYKKINGEWTYFNSSMATSPSIDEKMGEAVDIYGNFIIVGSPYRDEKGDVWLWEIKVEDGGIEAVQQLKRYKEGEIEDEGQVLDYFGSSVSINGNWCVVGAPGEDNGTGATYVYYKETGGNWELYEKLLGADGEEGDHFGYSVDIEGDILVVGAPDRSEEGIGDYGGKVYIFKKGESQWFQIETLISSKEPILNNPYHFGKKIALNNSYLVISSPGGMFIDIFVKGNNWGHLQRLEGEQNGFGDSLSLYEKYILCGAFSPDIIGEGFLYLFPNIVIRLAQEFIVEEAFVPSKISVYLKRGGKNGAAYFELIEDTENVIDATNFSHIDQNLNKFVIRDSLSNFSGNGYMQMCPDEQIELIDENNDITYSVLNYPVRSFVPNKYYLWLRGMAVGEADEYGMRVFRVDILIDNIVVRSISQDISSSEWEWIGTSIVIPDDIEHNIGIRIKEKGGAIDKIYMDTRDHVPGLEGPEYGFSPYVTIHLQLYYSENNIPVIPLYIYDYKTTINEIVEDDWYNFNTNSMDDSAPQLSVDYNDSYCILVSASGSSQTNYVIWEQIKTNEYLSNLSAVKFDWTQGFFGSSPEKPSEYRNLTNMDYYQIKQGNSDLLHGVWYINFVKSFAYRVYSDFDAIGDVL